MKDLSHSVFILFLLLMGGAAMASLSVKGCSYYETSLELRPFRPDYSTMKPSGSFSHGIGIIGSLMIIVGVAMYSTRKRMRALRELGKLSRWLEFHIFLCLLGPILVVYHTTFKVGGIAAISFWTMISVVASGVIGRFLYVQIPRNLKGAELSVDEIQIEVERLGASLQSSSLGATVIKMIDDAFAAISAPTTLMETFSTLLQLERIKIRTKKNIVELIKRSQVSAEVAEQLRSTSSSRASLLQKSLVLTQVERIFYYWHVIHLPFSVIMFLTLAAHVTVSILLGYTWIF